MFVYVAGPLTLGQRPANIHNAIKAATHIRERGHTPFVPHLFELWDTVLPQSYEFWMSLDIEWLRKCDLLVRLPGESSGADREVEEAKRIGIPVFYGMEEFMRSGYWTK